MDSTNPSSEGSARLESEAGVETTLPTAPPPMTVPARIGRYEVRECIGQGGMGVVLRATDSELGRDVAIKLLNPRPKPDPTHGMTRLLREAQALARLSHPNVIDVFDVGTVEGQVFIAMEYVRGVNLQIWLGDRPALPEIIDAFTQAGQGLVAAHRAGLVHRDFKPANVLRGEDGRVRVVDFGLAAPPREAEEVTVESDEGHVLDLRMTATGFAVGTPAYMSPEAHQGGLIDARSDQWSFCVSLYEALYAQRPFFGIDAQELADTLRRGLDPPAAAGVPLRLRELVLRGLSFDPDDRWPSMEAVLERLAPPRRRPWLWVGAGLGATAVLAGLGWVATTNGDGDDACVRAAAVVQEVWDDTSKRAVQAAFSASDEPYADRTWHSISGQLDDYARQLAEARRQTCLDPPVDESSSEPFDRRVACQRRRLSDLRVLVEVFEQADTETVRNAVQAVADLRPVSECDDDSLMASVPPPPPPVKADVEQAHGALARVRALARASHYDRARTLAEQTVAEARRLEYAPLLAEARHRYASVLEDNGEYALAEPEYEDARLIAQAAGDDLLVAQASSDLAYLTGSVLRRPEDAEQWVRHAEAAIHRLRDPSEALTSLEITRGNLRQSAGDFATAREHFERALETVSERRGLLHPTALHLRNNIALSYHHLGDNLRARELMLKLLADRIAVYGPGHFEVSATYGNLGIIEQTMGELLASAEHTQLALEGLEATVGPEHPHYPAMLTNLANTKFLMGDFEEALQVHQRCKTLLEDSVGPTAFLVGRSLVNMGAIHHQLGQLDEARRVYTRAVEIYEERLRPDHPEMAFLIGNLAHVDRESGRLSESIAGFDRSQQLLEKNYGPDHPELASGLIGRGHTHLRAEHYDEALRDLERAVQLLEGSDFDPENLARARFFLAFARWESGDRAGGYALMQRVHAEVLAINDGDNKLTPDVDAWLAKHDAPAEG